MPAKGEKMADYDPNLRTRMLARVAGPYLAIMGLTIALNAHLFALILPSFMQDRPLVLTSGAFILILGLVVIALHHHWTNAPAIAISLIGWAAALKGAWLMLTPELGAALSALVVRTPPLLLIVALAMIVLGIWLSLVGWTGSEKRA
jgi:hypothetical protein